MGRVVVMFTIPMVSMSYMCAGTKMSAAIPEVDVAWVASVSEVAGCKDVFGMVTHGKSKYDNTYFTVQNNAPVIFPGPVMVEHGHGSVGWTAVDGEYDSVNVD